MMMFTKTQALDELANCDHCFITPGGAAMLAAPFGLKPRTYVAKANPEDPKGLTFADGRKQAKGIAAEVLAADLCRHVGVSYAQKYGRGSQLRACIEALRDHYPNEGTATKADN